MKILASLVISSLLLAVPLNGAQLLLLHYDFDGIDSSTIPDRSGNNRDGQLQGTARPGSPGSGPSGKSSDTALDNSAAKMGATKSNSGGGVHLVGADIPGTLASFTVTGWFRTDGRQSLTDHTRLLSLLRKGGDEIRIMYHQGYLRMDIGKTSRVINGTHGLTDAQNQWVFFAITYDGSKTADNVNFYTGSREIPLVKTATNSCTLGPLDWGGEEAVLSFGANRENGRSVDGWLDNFRLYGSATDSSGALDKDAIREIMKEELSGE